MLYVYIYIYLYICCLFCFEVKNNADGRLAKRANISNPHDHETTNRYNASDDANSLMHEHRRPPRHSRRIVLDSQEIMGAASVIEVRLLPEISRDEPA